MIPWTVAYQAPLSMGFSQVRILKWAVISSSRRSSWSRDRTCFSRVFCIAGGFFTAKPPGMPQLDSSHEQREGKNEIYVVVLSWKCMGNGLNIYVLLGCQHTYRYSHSLRIHSFFHLFIHPLNMSIVTIILDTLPGPCCCSVAKLCPTLWLHGL